MSSKFGRREALRRGMQVVGGLAVAGPAARLLGGGRVSASGGLTPVSYQLSWLATVEHCGTYIAIEDGIFESLGVDVTPIPGGPTSNPVASVVGGQALVGATGADNIGAGFAEGAPVKIFGARLQKSPFCVVSLAETPITTPEELIGKTIGVAQSNQTPWNVFLQVAGIDPADVNVVPVQFDPAPTANGEVDGQVVFAINEPAQLQALGIDTATLLFADYGFAIYGGCYFATADTIANEADTLANFLLGERAGFEANIADPALGAGYTIDIYGADLGLDPAQQLIESGLLASVMVTPATEAHGLLYLDAADVADNIATLGIAGVDVDESLFTTEILDLLPSSTAPGSSVPGSSVPGMSVPAVPASSTP